MSLAVWIVGFVYIAAMVVMGGLWHGALRQRPSPSESRTARTNIIPFRSAPARSGAGEATES